MASPTAIPHPEHSAHHRHRSDAQDIASESSFKPSRPSFSPPNPSSIYSKATGAFSLSGANNGAGSGSLRLPVTMASNLGTKSSPTQQRGPMSAFSQHDGQQNGLGSAAHTRSRSQTTTCVTGTIAPEAFDRGVSKPQTPGSSEDSPVTPSTGSSYISSNDLFFSRSPTSPSSTSSVSTQATAGGFPPTYALGRVPSLPLGSSYEQAQKRLNSGSWSQSGGWSFGSFRGGASQPPFGSNGRAGEDSGGGGVGGGGVGGLLRRFSLSGNHHRHQRSPEHRYSIGSAAELGGAGGGGPGSRTASEGSQHGLHGATRDSGVGFDAERDATPKPQASSPRGRQGSISGNGKRKPSPMGERLLMGHFNAH